MGNHDDLVAATAEEVVAAVAADAERLAGFRRRFLLALYDVGLLDTVGKEWVLIGADGLEFRSLTFMRADAALRALEDLGRTTGRPATSGACSGQLGLF